MKPMSSSSLIAATVTAAYDYLQTPWAQQWKHSMPPETYRREMKTVAITLPRGIGHSTAALDLLQKYPTAHIMYPSYKIMSHFKNMTRDQGYSKDAFDQRMHVFSPSSRLENEKLAFKDVLRKRKSMVIFDALPPATTDRLFKVEQNYLQSGRPTTVEIGSAFQELIERLDSSTELFVYLQSVSV